MRKAAAPGTRPMCPLCGGSLQVQPGAKPVGEKAERYADCHEVCRACRIGITNARPLPTFIRDDWRAGLWETGDSGSAGAHRRAIAQ